MSGWGKSPWGKDQWAAGTEAVSPPPPSVLPIGWGKHPWGSFQWGRPWELIAELPTKLNLRLGVLHVIQERGTSTVNGTLVVRGRPDAKLTQIKTPTGKLLTWH